jgi:hypothetical protein
MMSKEIKYKDVVPNSIVTRYKEDNIQYLLDQVARLTAENAMLKEKWSAPKQPEPEQEPVAWMLIDKETGARIPKAYKPEHGVNKDRWEVYPLYTAPPKREPLSDEAICDILIKKEWKGFVELVRIIEKAHGIGGGEC